MPGEDRNGGGWGEGWGEGGGVAGGPASPTFQHILQ